MASPSSTLARPRSLMYMRSGTTVRPLAVVLPMQLVDLVAMQEQLAVAPRLVVVAVAVLARRDVRADQPRLAASIRA